MKVCADRDAGRVFSAFLTNTNMESFYKPQVTETWTSLKTSHAPVYKF